MKKLIFFLVVFILCISVCHGEDQRILQSDDVRILYDDGLEKAAVSTARAYHDIKERLEKLFEWKIDFYPDIYLVKDNDHFQQLSGHPLVVGYAVPEKMLIVIDYSKVLSDPFSVTSIIKHELCHLLLHKNIPEKNLPKWLDEGVSQWASGGLADIVMADRSNIDRAIVTGSYIPFRYLSRKFPVDNEALMLAYAQSRSIVEYMAREFDPAGVKSLLNSLKSGNAIDAAVNEVFLISFEELEKNWYSSMKRKTTWLTVLINHLYEVVFFLGAISLIIAYVKTVIRKRAMMDNEDDVNDFRKSP